MQRHLLSMPLLLVVCLLQAPIVDGQGKGTRPAPVRSTPVHRPSGSSSIPKTPSINPGVVHRPAPTTSVPRPIVKTDFHLPANTQRPAQMPKLDRAIVRLPNPPRPPAPLGKTPVLQSKLPAVQTRMPEVKTKLPAMQARLPEVKKNTPHLFTNPVGVKDHIPGAGKFPVGQPARTDLDRWLQVPKGHPPGAKPTWTGLMDKKVIQQQFHQNFQTAIKRGPFFDHKKGPDLSTNLRLHNLHQHALVVNSHFRPMQNNWFHPQWWQHHYRSWPWWHYHWAPHPSWWWWRPVLWSACTSWFVGGWGQPIFYDYGNNLVIYDNVVYLNQEPVASAPVYAQQALDLANVIPPSRDALVEWMPLGTWALSSNENDENPSNILQLALSKEGLVSGVWFNRTTDKSSPVEGKVDPQTQRLALHKPEQPDVVLEVGLYNLTQPASACLMHFGTLQTQTWYLVRLENPEAKGN